MFYGATPRTLDRIIGIVATLTGGLVFAFAHSWVTRVLLVGGKKRGFWEREGDNKSNDGRGGKGKASKGDENHQARYASMKSGPLVVHNGMCHCQRVRFRIKAPQNIKAVDVPSKIRFPRITIPCENFEPLTTTDDGILSLYAVKTESDPNVGVYTFCSFCGGKLYSLLH
jgi:hypothetical protein